MSEGSGGSSASRKAAALKELEDVLGEHIDPAFLTSQRDFRPLTHVIEVLSSEIVSDISSQAHDEPTAWLTIRTLAGKVMPLPDITPDATVEDVWQRLEEHGVSRAQGGMLYLNEQPLDEATLGRELRVLQGLPQPPKSASITICNAAYVDLQRQLKVVDNVVEQFLGQHYSTLSSSVRPRLQRVL